MLGFSGKTSPLVIAVALLCAALPSRACAQSSEAIDRPETGRQGETLQADIASGRALKPYHKGVRLVGHTDIWNRGANLNMAWIGSCAYVSSAKGSGPQAANSTSTAYLKEPAGVAVIDVSNPAAPRSVKLLRDRGSIDASETLHAIEAGGRRILVAGNYSGGIPFFATQADAMKSMPAVFAARPGTAVPLPEPSKADADQAWLSIYDATDCKNPKLMSEFKWPANVHMVTISPNGQRVYGTEIVPGLTTGLGGILVLDISDLAKPRFIGEFGATLADGSTRRFTTHEVHLSADERRAYASVYASEAGGVDQSKDGSVYILDNSDIVEGRANPKMRLLGEAQHGGWHSVVPAQIGGVPHLVGAAEPGTCPGVWPKIIDIADEAHPRIVGQFKLEMNTPQNCHPAPLRNQIASHFNDVDDAHDTHLGLFPFIAAGLRIVDLRDPAKPVEVAYFKPGLATKTVLTGLGLPGENKGPSNDACMSHVRYAKDTGQIWFACVDSGFYVIELTAQLRASLGLPRLQK